MNKLFICEKPSQARDIARNLGASERHDGYISGNNVTITWCFGHLLALAPPEHYEKNLKPWRMEVLPVIPNTWKMIVTKHGKKQFTIVKQLLKETQHLILAQDPDREGEAIGREIVDYCNYQGKIERLWLRALDDASIKKALAQLKPNHETINLYYAALARSRSDYVIGMNCTMAASSLYGINSVLSLGRVQTPTLKLVVDRDTTIENFTAKDYYTLKATFKTRDNATFDTIWQADDAKLDEQGYCIDKNQVEAVASLIEDEPGIIKRFTQTKKYQKAPLCYSLSALQKKASSLFGYGVKDTLAIVQSLYETHKAVTYPRTDCGYLPTEQLQEVEPILTALTTIDSSINRLVEKCDPKFQSSVWNDDKITAHHAIIPTTNDKVDISNFSEKEFNVYHLIRLQYLAQFLGDYEYEARNTKISCAGEIFKAIGHIPKVLGFKLAFVNEPIDEDEATKTGDVSLPLLNQNDALHNINTKLEAKKTKPPARFTEGTLIEAMKTVGKFVEDSNLRTILKNSHGIGTEATRANIIEILFKRDYLSKKGKQVISTDKGRSLIQLAPKLLIDPVLTAQWEEKLDLIAQGQFEHDTFVKAQVTLLHEMLHELQHGNIQQKTAALQLKTNSNNGKAYACPVCNAPLRRIKNKKGNFFYGCTAYPTCKFTTWEKDGKPNL